MSSNDADGMANSVDPDQTAPLGAVWSGSTLFAQACLSENLGSLWYNNKLFIGSEIFCEYLFYPFLFSVKYKDFKTEYNHTLNFIILS